MSAVPGVVRRVIRGVIRGVIRERVGGTVARRGAPVLLALAAAGGVGSCVAVGPDGMPVPDGAMAPTPVAVLARADGDCSGGPDGAPDAGRVADAVDGPGGVAGYAFRIREDWHRHLVGWGAAAKPAPPGRVAASVAGTVAGWPVAFESGETVILLDAGQRPNPGHRLRVVETETAAQAGILVVSASMERPPAGSIQPQVVVHPCVYLHVGPADWRRLEIAGG